MNKVGITNKQAREIFDRAMIGQPDENVAKLELLREYFTNPKFRRALEQMTWEQNNA